MTREAKGRKTRVAVIFGGQSDEHDVSLRSAQTVMSGLDPGRYEVVEIGITRDGRWLTNGRPMEALTAHSPLFALPSGADSSGKVDLATISQEMPPVDFGNSIDVVFPVLHGPMGEDGTVQGMLELLGMPYVGAGVLGSAVAMDKAMAKVVMTQAGIPQGEWLLVQRHDLERDSEPIQQVIADTLGFPCFTKPSNMGSSVGVTKVHGPEELEAGLREAARYDRRIVVERGIAGRELEVSVLGNDFPVASVAGEIIASNEFYDYNAKYVDDLSESRIPAEIDDELMEEIQRLACRAFVALDLAGMARVDFFLENETNRLLLNEVNSLPGFTSISMYPMLWEASGLPLPELIDRLIALAIDRFDAR